MDHNWQFRRDGTIIIRDDYPDLEQNFVRYKEYYCENCGSTVRIDKDGITWGDVNNSCEIQNIINIHNS